MSKEFEGNNKDQASVLSYGFSDISSNNELAKNLLDFDGNKTETKTKTPTNSDIFDNPKLLMINNTNNIDINLNSQSIIIKGNNNIINKYHSEILKDINYKKKYEDLLTKYNEVLKENIQ